MEHVESLGERGSQRDRKKRKSRDGGRERKMKRVCER